MLECKGVSKAYGNHKVVKGSARSSIADEKIVSSAETGVEDDAAQGALGGRTRLQASPSDTTTAR